MRFKFISVLFFLFVVSSISAAGTVSNEPKDCSLVLIARQTKNALLNLSADLPVNTSVNYFRAKDSSHILSMVFLDGSAQETSQIENLLKGAGLVLSSENLEAIIAGTVDRPIVRQQNSSGQNSINVLPLRGVVLIGGALWLMGQSSSDPFGLAVNSIVLIGIYKVLLKPVIKIYKESKAASQKVEKFQGESEVATSIVLSYLEGIPWILKSEKRTLSDPPIVNLIASKANRTLFLNAARGAGYVDIDFDDVIDIYHR